jgi:hypothetical protein
LHRRSALVQLFGLRHLGHQRSWLTPFRSSPPAGRDSFGCSRPLLQYDIAACAARKQWRRSPRDMMKVTPGNASRDDLGRLAAERQGLSASYGQGNVEGLTLGGQKVSFCSASISPVAGTAPPPRWAQRGINSCATIYVARVTGYITNRSSWRPIPSE